MSVDLSDAEFFAQFDKDASAELPALSLASHAAKNPQQVLDKLVDFDALELVPNTGENFKVPKA